MLRLCFERRPRFLLACAMAVAAAHAALLAAWPFEARERAQPVRAEALQVRSLMRPPLAAAADAPETAAPAADLPRLALSEPAAPPAVRRRAALAATPQLEPMPELLALAALPALPAPPMLAVAAAMPIVAAQPQRASAEPVPVYATRLPPAGQWRYRMQRGVASGTATLSWIPAAGAAYSLRLEGSVAGVTVLDWASQGAIDAHGIAPERFAIRRRGRDHQAANFQREAGKITFSGPTHEVALVPGVQDRLSWMLQLPAVVQAAPARFASPGARIVMMVVGARGGADVWHIVALGREAVDGVAALKFVREPRERYDTRAEVWLDPARGHLPLRAVLTQAEGGAALELQLER